MSSTALPLLFPEMLDEQSTFLRTEWVPAQFV